MQLIYIWVKEYKNIYELGFNFNPMYTCKYKNGHLKVIKNDPSSKNIPKFFDDKKKITIKAIVGENGAGKSSLLDEILTPFGTSLKVYVDIKGTYYVKSGLGNIDELQKKSNINFIVLNKYVNKIHLNSDIIRIDKGTNYSDYFQTRTHMSNIYLHLLSNPHKFKHRNILDISKYGNEISLLMIKNSKTFSSNLFNYNPNKISVFPHHLNKFDSKLSIKNDGENHNDDVSDKMDKLLEILNSIQSNYKNYNIENKFFTFLLFKIVQHCKNLSDLEKLGIYPIVVHAISYSSYIEKFKPDIKSFIKNNNDFIKNIFPSFTQNLNNYVRFLNSNFSNNVSYDVDDFNKIIVDEELDIFSDLIRMEFLSIEFRDEKDMTFFELSQGERKIFLDMLIIYENLKDDEDAIIVLDEPDLTLHPQRQKNYMYELIEIFKKLNKFIQLIITTHSPFILSDLTKEHVIFFKKCTETGKCIDVSKEIEINPFGANIHTLLSDNFFMNGTLGKFAKLKIDKLIKDLKQEDTLSKERQDEIYFEILNIGEGFIKDKLLSMFNKKYDIAINEKIEMHRKEIEKLKREKMLKIEFNKNLFELHTSILKNKLKNLIDKLIIDKKIVKKKLNKETRKYIDYDYLILEKKELDYLRKLNLDILLKSKFTLQIINEFDFIYKDSKIFKLAKYIFEEKGYNYYFTSGVKEKGILYNAYYFVESLNLLTCPYCNRNYIYTTKRGKVRPQIDHFLPKASYPYLALNFFNLIPSCPQCNKTKGDKVKKDLLNPYDMRYNSFLFTYEPNNINFLYVEKQKYKFKDFEVKLEKEHLENTKLFKLDLLYEKHTEEVLELLVKKAHYPDTYIKELEEKDFTKEEIYRFLYSNYSKSEDFHRRPLSKLTYDISKELGLLFNTEDYTKKKNERSRYFKQVINSI